MKLIKNILVITGIISVFTACDTDDEATPSTTGSSFVVEFDHFVGSQPLTLDTAGSTNYRYQTADGQAFNLSTFRYYISNVVLEGPNGERFEDPMQSSPNADEVRGYYLVQEGEPNSQLISLAEVPTGTYNKLTLTLGIAEEGVQEGAQGGILDPAAGAWFWNWNSGYISLGMEGTAEDSPQERQESDFGVQYARTFAVHIGGWKGEADDERLVNNIRTISLDFDAVSADEQLQPTAHLVFDVLAVLDGAAIDFSQTYSVHSPRLGAPFADQLSKAFTVDHVHQ